MVEFIITMPMKKVVRYSLRKSKRRNRRYIEILNLVNKKKFKGKLKLNGIFFKKCFQKKKKEFIGFLKR